MPPKRTWRAPITRSSKGAKTPRTDSILRQKPVFEPSRAIHLYAARLYEIDAWHPRAAIAAVQAGSATLIVDTDDPDLSINLEELVPDMFAD
jgi:dihydropteroate synthase